MDSNVLGPWVPKPQRPATSVVSPRNRSGKCAYSLWAQEVCSTSALYWRNKPVQRENLGQCSRSKEGWFNQLLHIQYLAPLGKPGSEAHVYLQRVILWSGLIVPSHTSSLVQFPGTHASLRPVFSSNIWAASLIHSDFTQMCSPGAVGDASLWPLPDSLMQCFWGIRTNEMVTWAAALGRWRPKLQPR